MVSTDFSKTTKNSTDFRIQSPTGDILLLTNGDDFLLTNGGNLLLTEPKASSTNFGKQSINSTNYS